MAPMLSLQINKRDKLEDLSAMRKNGVMPAVFYGKKEPSTPISIANKDFLKVWKEAGESSVVSLAYDGGSVDALIHAVDFDAVTGVPIHADFYVFEKGRKLEVSVPLEFTGISPAIKDLGGLLVKVMHEVKIEALPADLPHSVSVDISSLIEIGSQILAKDIKLGSGVSLMENLEEVVALVSAPKEEEPEEVAPVDLSAIEVEKKGKEAKEGEAEEAPAGEAKAEEVAK